jgi:hypothetical protein
MGINKFSKNKKLILALLISWTFIHLVFLIISNGDKKTFWPFDSQPILDSDYDITEFLVYVLTPILVLSSNFFLNNVDFQNMKTSVIEFYKSNTKYSIFFVLWVLLNLISLLISNCTWGIFPDYPKLFFPFSGYPNYFYPHEKNPFTLLIYTYSYSEFLVYLILPFIIRIIFIKMRKNQKKDSINSVKTIRLKEVDKNENDLTYDIENRESDTNELKEIEKQKEVILDLINSGVYSQGEGNIKIKQLAARELEIIELKEKKINYDKALKNLVYLLYTKLINDDEFNQKLKQIKQDYLNENTATNVINKVLQEENNLNEIKKQQDYLNENTDTNIINKVPQEENNLNEIKKQQDYLNENTDTNIINKVPQEENNLNEIKNPDEIENKPKILFGMNYVDFIALLCLTFLMIVLIFFGN